MALRSIKDYVLAQLRGFHTSIIVPNFVAKEANKSLISATDLAKIGTNESAIATLNGNASTVGSVANSIGTALGSFGEKDATLHTDYANAKDYIDTAITRAFDDFATNVTNNDVVDTYKELVDYAAAHQTEAASMASDITTLKANSSTAGSVDYKVSQAIGNLGNKTGNTPYADVKDYVDTKIANAQVDDADINFATEWDVQGA